MGDMMALEIKTEGRCMRPWLWPGGTLRITRCSIGELNLGDVAVWFDGERLLSHRVVKLGAGEFTTRGDLSLTDDPVALPHQLVGRATQFTWRGLSYSLEGQWPGQAGRTLATIYFTVGSKARAAWRSLGAAAQLR